MIRRGAADDVPALQAVERNAAQLFRSIGFDFCADGPVRDDAEHARVLREGASFVATSPEDEIAAFALVIALDDDAHLMEISTDPAHQRRGISRMLIDACEVWAKNEGFAAMTLTTFRNVPWNAPYYEKLGFSEFDPIAERQALHQMIAEERKSGFHREPRIVMRKELA